uniref:Ig-like domain-containing protein n=1 Tax=Salvator merianae TaxID=96440 RepID=A0A8D0E375_SALMN
DGAGRTACCPWLSLPSPFPRPPLFSIPFPPPQHFLYQVRSECHFVNRTEQVRFLDRYFWDRQELFNYDSDLGKFVAISELGRQTAEQCNQDKDLRRRVKAEVHRFCRLPHTVSFSGHNTLMICDVAGFFPPKIEIKWLKNGKELEDLVWTTHLIRNGDWTFQIQAMLETQPERGDIYGCWVNHTSFEEPVMAHWGKCSDFLLPLPPLPCPINETP